MPVPLQSQWQTYQQSKFVGENKIPALEVLAPEQLLVAYNTVATADYSLESRKGKTALNDTLGAGPIRGLWRFAKSGGTAYLVALHGTTLYAGTWAGGSATCTFASIKTGLDATAPLRGVVWKDNLILTNGVQNPFRYDGSACTDLSGTPPKSQFITVYANRLFLVDVANPNQLRWSGLETYDTWDALDVILVRDNDGDKINGLAALNGGLVILKRNSMWTLYGTYYDDMQLVQLSDSVGCIAPDSIVTLKDGGTMLSADNLYQFNLSEVVEYPKTHKILITPMSNAERAAVKGCVVPAEKRAVMMLSRLCLNIEGSTGGITTWTDINAGAFAVADSAIDDGSLLIGDATNGVVYALNNETAGEFQTEFWLPFNDMGSTRKKVWRIFAPEFSVLDGSSDDGTATIFLRYDVDRGQKLDFLRLDGESADVLVWSSGGDWDAKVWGAVETQQRWPMHNARGRRVSLQIATTSRIKFEGYQLQFREVGKLL